jgi:hypothetical protein
MSIKYKITEAQLKRIIANIITEDVQSSVKTPKAYLLFDGKTLRLMEDNKVSRQWNAWSGRTKWNAITDYQKKMAETMDKIDFMKVKEAGPIPEGNYSISSIQQRSNGNSLAFCGNKTWVELAKLFIDDFNKRGDSHSFNSGTPQDLISWGNYRMPISPKNGTNTYGRGNFYLHGGGIAGSIGCIDLVDQIDDFVSVYKDYLNRTGAKYIDIVVDYSGKITPPITVSTSPENIGDPRSVIDKGITPSYNKPNFKDTNS